MVGASPGSLPQLCAQQAGVRLPAGEALQKTGRAAPLAMYLGSEAVLFTVAAVLLWLGAAPGWVCVAIVALSRAMLPPCALVMSRARRERTGRRRRPGARDAARQRRHERPGRAPAAVHCGAAAAGVSALGSKLRLGADGLVMFKCPGCNGAHGIHTTPAAGGQRRAAGRSGVSTAPATAQRSRRRCSSKPAGRSTRLSFGRRATRSTFGTASLLTVAFSSSAIALTHWRARLLTCPIGGPRDRAGRVGQRCSQSRDGRDLEGGWIESATAQISPISIARLMACRVP
ncbi:hypothetical protein ACFDR9_003636 [Janthinobacterium sp. CG_23.3]